MKKALLDAAGVLLAFGFCQFTPTGGQSVIDVPEDFNMSPQSARWDGTVWQPYTPTPPDPEVQALAALAAGGPIDEQKLIRATFVNFTARALGVAPGALTPAQLSAERARVAAIYKVLP